MLLINELKKTYENFSLNVTLNVKKGQITGLVGQNGAGKSTAFKAALGLIDFDGGEIRLLGKDIKEFTEKDKEKLGVVLSDSGFSGYLTVKDIVPILRALYTEFNESFFNEQVKRFELPVNKQIKEFSTGMKAKLKVLVAVSHNAKLLILDECTAGLDVVARDDLLLMLREYMEKNSDCAVLISSHISSDLEGLCDDIYMIHSGEIILHEDTDVLLSNYAILKLDEKQFADIDKQYILYKKSETYGFCCLTNQKQYYIDNFPQITVEKGSIDGVITMLIKGEKL